MTERSYKDGELKVGNRSFHIYCTVCDSLVIIRENIIECANDHLNKCIAKTANRRFVYSNPIQKNVKKGGRVTLLSSDKIDKIFTEYSGYGIHGQHAYNTLYEIKEPIAYRIFNSATVIQRAWKNYMKRLKSLAYQVWNMVRNDDTPDKKKFLGITPRGIRIPDNQYVLYYN